MTQDQQRIAIATACGLQNVAPVIVQNVKHEGDDRTVGISSDSGWVPDYLGDLNACHEMEKVLMEKGVNAWWSYVAFINRHNPRPFGTETAVHATAPQRCEAFLRTLGLWEEEANTTKSVSSTSPATEESSVVQPLVTKQIS